MFVMFCEQHRAVNHRRLNQMQSAPLPTHVILIHLWNKRFGLNHSKSFHQRGWHPLTVAGAPMNLGSESLTGGEQFATWGLCYNCCSETLNKSCIVGFRLDSVRNIKKKKKKPRTQVGADLVKVESRVIFVIRVFQPDPVHDGVNHTAAHEGLKHILKMQ